MAILNDLSRDLDWRESEIASMRIVLSRGDLSNTQYQALLRAAWAMLYAHYEGFAKYCLTLFFAEIARRAIPCIDLPSKARAFVLGPKIKQLRTLGPDELLEELTHFRTRHLLPPAPTFPDVDTRANLWPETLIELLDAADLRSDVVARHRDKLNTLVARRNGIAHGEKSFIAEFSYYRGFENAVYDVMYDLVFQIDERLSATPYLALAEG